MNKTSYHVLRIGLAITFLWIGILILKQPEAWAGYLQPWAVKLLPVPVEQALVGTAVLDLIVGIMLLIDSFVWVIALVGAIHLVIILVTSGITDITARDIGLLAGTVALVIESLPKSFYDRMKLS